MVVVIGNGSSLKSVDFDKLTSYRTYAVNEIWKLWRDNPKIKWRPTDYVRCEKPRLDAQASNRDIFQMSAIKDLNFHLENRLEVSWRRCRRPGISTHNYHFETCDGKEEHNWHFPQICGYGTVVTTAIQIAVLDGASEIYLLGCDLTMPSHPWGETGIDRNDLALRAHKIAASCSPVPIYNATIDGNLNVYERKDFR
jgi:hypothetical protein